MKTESEELKACPCPLCKSPLQETYTLNLKNEAVVSGWQHVNYTDSDCSLKYFVVSLRDVPAWNRRTSPERGEVIEALRKISAKQYEHRDTVTPDNAFRHFGKLNAEVCEIFRIADTALSTDRKSDGPEGSAESTPKL